MDNDLTTLRTRRIAVVTSPRGEPSDVIHALHDQAEVSVITQPDAAVAAIRAQEFDYVLAASSELLPLARAAGQLQTEAILEAISQAVCIVGIDGELTWANRRFRAYPEPVQAVLRSKCAAWCKTLADEPPAEGRPRVVQETLAVGRDATFDLSGSALLADDGKVDRFVAMLWDMTGTRRLQEKLNALDAAGRDLLGLDSDAVGKLDAHDRLRLLEQKVIEYGRTLLNYDHLIIRVLDPKTRRLETVITFGISEQAAAMEILADAKGQGISGYVAATGHSYICPDIANDDRYLPGLEHAQSSLTVPLKLGQRVIGVFNVESERLSAFTEDDRQSAEIFARYIAMALQILQLLVGERYAIAGQFAADMAAELAGPLSDIIRDVSSVLDAHGSDEALRTKLQTIITDVEKIRTAARRATESGCVGGLIPQRDETDPLLSGKRILVADDEDVIRETIAEVLAKCGAMPVMARDGNEALSLLAAGRFDLVLSDIRMPSKNGYEVYSAVRSSNANCPVILITGFGYDPNHSIIRASKEGLGGVLFKPFKVDQLLEEVRSALTASKS